MRGRNSLKRTASAGFTLIEMLVIAPVVILSIGAFITVIISMTGEVISSRASNALTYNVQDALSRIEQDTKLSTAFLAQNNIPFSASNPQGYGANGSTTNFTNVGGVSGTSLILNMLATTDNPLSTSAGVVYLANAPNACGSPSVTSNQPMYTNVVYFVRDDDGAGPHPSTLWRRTIMPVNYYTSAYCQSPWQLPSCVVGYSGSFCETEDIKLVEGVSADDFNVSYYTSASSTSPNAAASNSGLPATTRGLALQTTPTVGVTINAEQQVAGRTIERSAELRATRLDVNASTIAPVVADTAPSVPVVTGSYAAPNIANFSWPVVSGGNVVYDVDYNIDGGSWITGATDTTDTSYSVTSPANNQTVNIRVRAQNSVTPGGTSYATASVVIPFWVPLLLKNSWTNYGAPFTTAAFTKTSTGLVVIKGMLKGGTATTGTIIGTLPAGYRPSHQMLFQNSANSATARVDVDINGNILFQVGANPWYSLDGMAFMPSGTTFTNIAAFSNSWTNFDPVSYEPAGYYQFPDTRVILRGMIKSGTVADGTQMFTIPTTLQPALYEHVSNDNSNASGMIGVSNTSGIIQAKGGGNSFLATHAIFYPAAYAGWTTMTLQNSWVYYGAPYSTPRYTKSADGLVMLKGLIRAGSVASTAVIASIPGNLGLCPKQQLLLTVITSGGWGRVDITPATSPSSGCTVIVGQASSVNATWTSLDGIVYIGEW